MRFSLQREVLLKSLSHVVNVVEKRQTLPILSNVLVQVESGKISITGTDTKIEIVSSCETTDSDAGEATIPARKFFDIVRALPDGSFVKVEKQGDKVSIRAGKSRFSLMSLNAKDFPALDSVNKEEQIEIPEATLKELIERTAFAMALQDVRQYLNGLLFDFKDQTLRCVATDGHRLAICEAAIDQSITNRKIIVHRKGIHELQRLLESTDKKVALEVSRTHLRLIRDDVIFTSSLIEGEFPAYEAVLPIGADKKVTIDREAFRASLERTKILSNEKYRSIRIEISPNLLKIQSNNPEQEEANEELEAQTQIEALSIGFNVNYLLEALNALRDEQVVMSMRDANSSALVQEASNDRSRHVVMPLRL